NKIAAERPQQAASLRDLLQLRPEIVLNPVGVHDVDLEGREHELLEIAVPPDVQHREFGIGALVIGPVYVIQAYAEAGAGGIPGKKIVAGNRRDKPGYGKRHVSAYLFRVFRFVFFSFAEHAFQTSPQAKL